MRDDGEAARALIERLGEQAACYATHEALKARRRGDRASSERWHWIAGAVREILRSEPDGRR